jgi:hypothetical protein
MDEFTIDAGEEGTILVEFAPQAGVQPTSYSLDAAGAQEQLAELSKKALDNALSTIRNMAWRVRALHDRIPHEFTQIEVEFGIKLDAEAGALLAKAGGEAAISVTLTWERQPPGQQADE